jgi:hypothetical protein
LLRNKKEIGPILQHYGFKTPWIDVVDNIYTAVWFAQNRLKPQEQFREESNKISYIKNETSGWLTFIATKNHSNDKLLSKNLQSSESSLSLRLSAQHGYSLMHPNSTNSDVVKRCSNLDDYIVGRVEFPNTHWFNIDSQFISAKNLFPIEVYDRMAKVFLESKITEECKIIEDKYKLTEMLGRYRQVKHR